MFIYRRRSTIHCSQRQVDRVHGEEGPGRHTASEVHLVGRLVNAVVAVVRPHARALVRGRGENGDGDGLWVEEVRGVIVRGSAVAARLVLPHPEVDVGGPARVAPWVDAGKLHVAVGVSDLGGRSGRRGAGGAGSGKQAVRPG